MTKTKLIKFLLIISFVFALIFVFARWGYYIGYKRERSFQYKINLIIGGANSYHEIANFIDKDFSGNPEIALCYLRKSIARRHEDMKDCLANPACIEYMDDQIGIDKYTALSEKITELKIDIFDRCDN